MTYSISEGAVTVASSQNTSGLLEPEYVQTQRAIVDGGDRFGVSSLIFDRHEELLWVGNQGGHVTSYYTGTLSKYTSFQVHAHEEVRQILTIDECIMALTASSLRCQIRRGIPVFTYMSENSTEMQCLLQMSPTRILIGGHKDKLIDFNMNIGEESQVVNVRDRSTVLLRRHNRYVCCGSPSGQIELRDPNSLKLEHTLESHTGSLSDFDVQENLLITCGFSNSRVANLAVDRFLMVYDLRMMRAIMPMQTLIDPLYLRFLPSLTSRLAVVSACGQVQLLDTIALAEPKISMLQMDNPGAMCLTFDVSGTSQVIAFGDNNGQIHLFSASDNPVFNNYSRSTELPDSVVQYDNFNIDEYETSLSSVPVPYIPANVTMTSDWPEHLIQYSYRKSAEVDPKIIDTMKMQGPIGYAPNIKTIRRNQVRHDKLKPVYFN